MKVSLITSILMDYVDGRLMPISMDKLCSCPPYGVYLLGTILREKGHDVNIIDLAAQGSMDLSQHEKDIQNSTLIGVSATSLSWPSARNIIKKVREISPDSYIVLGGIHATMFDKYILSTLPVDFIVRGEGEIALPLLAEKLEKNNTVTEVPNLSTIKDDNFQRTHLHPPIKGKDMGGLPVVDYSQAPLSKYSGLAIESSRGCPFSCSFCSTSFRNSWRGMSPEDFVSRVEKISPYRKETKQGYIQIVDDEFPADWRRATQIANLFSKKNLDVPLIFDSRANDMLHEDFLTAIAPHTQQFLIGAECGYDEGLQQIGKGTTCAKLEKTASVLQKNGINERCEFSFIIGLPWETKEEVMKTIRFACSLYAKYGVRIVIQWYYLLPGSELWNKAAIEGKVNASMYDNYGFFRNPYLFFTGVQLSPEEIWDISENITSVINLAKLNDRGEEFIQYRVPEAVRLYFNKQSLREASISGLDNLKELSENVKRGGEI